MTWATVFNRYKQRGCDPSDAAYRADQWLKRQDQTRWSRCCSTHCERSQECRSPNDCCAEGRVAAERRGLIKEGGADHG